MPQGGELVVSESIWFIWPEFEMLGTAMSAKQPFSDDARIGNRVPKVEFIGRPFKRWFGRTTDLWSVLIS